MPTGTIGLYQEVETKVIFYNLRKGDYGAPLEDILPVSMRGDAFADAPVMDFLQMVRTFLVTNAQWVSWNKANDKHFKRHPDQTIKREPPALDLVALKVIKTDGEVDYAKVGDLFAVIAPHWDMNPPLGLVPAMIAEGYQLSEIAGILAMYHKYGGELPRDRFDPELLKVFMPPELDGTGKLLTTEQIEHALAWCRRPNKQNGLPQDNLMWNLNLRELGLLNPNGSVNRAIAKLARDFIWQDRERDPDYAALRDYLAPYQPVQPAVKPTSKPLPKAALDKIKKQKRKAGRIKRRRGRR